MVVSGDRRESEGGRERERERSDFGRHAQDCSLGTSRNVARAGFIHSIQNLNHSRDRYFSETLNPEAGITCKPRVVSKAKAQALRFPTCRNSDQ